MKTKDGIKIKKRNLYYLIVYDDCDIIFWGQGQCSYVEYDIEGKEYAVFCNGYRQFRVYKTGLNSIIYKKFEKAKKALKKISKKLILTHENKIKLLNGIHNCSKQQLCETRRQRVELNNSLRQKRM